MRMLKFIFILFFILLAGCARENSVRGVPVAAWNQLNAEQRQLIVDQSYQEEFKQPVINN